MILAALAALLTAYVASYCSLSAGGRYEPLVIGTNGVKAYDWAPRRFVHKYRWRMGLVKFYLPLYLIDRRIWHRQSDVHSGKYPVHRPEDLGEVARAWRR